MQRARCTRQRALSIVKTHWQQRQTLTARIQAATSTVVLNSRPSRGYLRNCDVCPSRGRAWGKERVVGGER